MCIRDRFNYYMEVERIGVFAASSAKSGARPGHTAIFDYFFNADAPLAPEDANAPGITVNKVGQGTVTQTPAGPNYTCGQQVQLQATPASGWLFQNWSGDLNGTGASRLLTISGKHTVTANFLQRTNFDLFLDVYKRQAMDTTPIEIFNESIEVMPGGTMATVTWDTDVPGTSVVDYGETTLYEIGTKADDELKTEHTVLLTGQMCIRDRVVKVMSSVLTVLPNSSTDVICRW